jgi:hypothetical protein
MMMMSSGLSILAIWIHALDGQDIRCICCSKRRGKCLTQLPISLALVCMQWQEDTTFPKQHASRHTTSTHTSHASALQPGDRQHHVHCCRWLVEIANADADFNTHNIHYWAHENRILCKKERERWVCWSLSVLIGLQGDCIIGPYLLPECRIAITYSFIDKAVWLLLENLPLTTREQMRFQYDGAPPHYGCHVCNLIDERFCSWWFSQGGLIHWCPQPSNINKPYWFLCVGTFDGKCLPDFPHWTKGQNSPSACCCGYGKLRYVAECLWLHHFKSD